MWNRLLSPEYLIRSFYPVHRCCYRPQYLGALHSHIDVLPIRRYATYCDLVVPVKLFFVRVVTPVLTPPIIQIRIVRPGVIVVRDRFES
jgi:hypothetical protein